MKLELSGLRLPLAHFPLAIDAMLSAPITAVFGPSGAGKTTLLEIIAGLRRPEMGRVMLDGNILTDVTAGLFVPPERRGIGYVPQEGALFPHLSVRRNLLYGRHEAGARATRLSLEHVSEILEIASLMVRATGTLSGGEKQRVALGRALLASPRLLLLDEPLAGLDQVLRERLLPYLARVHDEFALPMIYVTHAPDEVVTLCQDTLVLEHGRVARHGPPTTLFRRSAGPHYELRPVAAPQARRRETPSFHLVG